MQAPGRRAGAGPRARRPPAASGSPTPRCRLRCPRRPRRPRCLRRRPPRSCCRRPRRRRGAAGRRPCRRTRRSTRAARRRCSS
ncbi:MAG: hypothetical protein D6731_18540 [Planctomycetota bacterium]|nr:MAG: hypothetical protein D6731_18540 [Planctomycetota bacterium]